MGSRPTNPLEARMYRIFRISKEQYIVTVKLLFIYRWVVSQAGGEDPFHVAEAMRRDFIVRGRYNTLDAMFRAAEHAAYVANNRYAPSSARVPDSKDAYIGGWHP